MYNFQNATTTKRQGDMGLGVAIGWFSKNGYIVSIPLTDSQNYDLVIDRGGLKKVQVKSTYFVCGKHYKVELSTRGGVKGEKKRAFIPSAVDYLFLVCENEDLYLIPTFEGMPQSMTLGKKYDQYRVETGCAIPQNILQKAVKKKLKKKTSSCTICNQSISAKNKTQKCKACWDKNRKLDKTCQNCNKKVHRCNSTGLCWSCYANRGTLLRRKVKNRPTKEILKKQVNKIGYCATARLYGVSDNAVRKWLK